MGGGSIPGIGGDEIFISLLTRRAELNSIYFFSFFFVRGTRPSDLAHFVPTFPVLPAFFSAQATGPPLRVARKRTEPILTQTEYFIIFFLDSLTARIHASV